MPDPSSPAATDLLTRHAPSLRYDSGERYFAVPVHRDRHGDTVYGHATTGSDGRIWLQYWLYYAMNDPRLLGTGIGAHEGDWEMIQLRVDAAGAEPDLAIYAQHSRVRSRLWEQVERVGFCPVIYVGRGSHASYFSGGRHWTGAFFERADGRGRAVVPQMEAIVDGHPDFAWVQFPGRWGSTPRPPGPLGRYGGASPHGPAHQRQWRDPAVLLAEL